jgi:hypothetical protein
MARLKKTSEFGKGFVYNLVLFAKHWWNYREFVEQYKELRKTNPLYFREESATSLWFNAAGDHFYELEIPEKFKRRKWAKRLLALQDKALRWRLDELGGRKEFDKFWEELEDILMKIDKDLGVKPIEADYS